MPTAWDHRRVRLPWGRMSVYTTGTGPPLLLLHGLGGSGRYWAGLAARLGEHRHLIAPDLAGFGHSDKPKVDYSRDFHVAALHGLLEGLGVDGPVAVAGHSMGGILAALLAARRPALTESLALVAAPYPRRQLRPYGMPHGAVRLGLYRGMQGLLPILSPLVRSPTFPRAVISDYLRHTVDSYQKTSNALIWDPTVAAELSVLGTTAPRRTLLLYSNEDTTIGPDSLDLWRAILPRAEVQQIPGAHQLLLRDHFATLGRWYGAPADEPTTDAHEATSTMAGPPIAP